MNSSTSIVNGELQVTSDRCLRYSIFEPTDSPESLATLIFIPGFKGFKDWGGWPWFCGLVSAKRYRVLAINPTMCGVGSALTEFDEPDKFSHQTLSHDVEDLAALLNSPIIPHTEPLFLVGHSRGGIVAALSANHQRQNAQRKIDGVVTLGTPHDLMRLDSKELDQWREQGYRDIVNVRTGEVLKQDVKVLEDYMLHSSQYDPAKALAETGIPVLGIHGTEDPAVSADSLDLLMSGVSHPHSRKELIAGAGHTFGMVHPHQGAHEYAETVVKILADWLREAVQR
ncbi:hypothetical protein CBD41_02975 [bacterium TMED181]|nr:hypothetical protein [Planctomycetota bacterium]OUW46123.1 MAG: hypothetical protein CBD41_02975 [bacterium TMED181]